MSTRPDSILSFPRRGLIVSAFTVLAVGGFSLPARAVTVYVDGKAGKNSYSGTSKKPVKDLTGAQRILKRSNETSATIYIKSGVYYQPEPFYFDSSFPQDRLNIKVWGSGKPTFDGRYGTPDSNHFWLTVRSGKRVNVSNVKVRYYNRGGVNLDNSDNNTFTNVEMRYIGDKAFDGDGPGKGRKQSKAFGLGGFYLKHSDNNVFDNLLIQDTVNKGSTFGHVHSLYFSYESSDNTVKNSRFERSTGDLVRLRYGASGNTFSDNVLNFGGRIGTDRAMYSYWRFPDDGDKCGTGNKVRGGDSNKKDYADTGTKALIGNGSSNIGEKCDNPWD